jgi:glycogen operon protein
MAHRTAFDWSGDRSPRHESDAIIYELHVSGFTKNPNSGVDPSSAGTYAGLVEKIPYLKTLGITIVELMPVFQRDPQEGDYWGYMPLNFFAPHAQYASTRDDGQQHIEFRKMVKAFHEADICVVLDVVYNHTCEGDHTGPIYSFKGLDNAGYYMLSSDPANPYANYSGTGNTLNFGQAHVRKMLMDSLRYWKEEMHIDGFRFDLASVFSRNADGSLNWGDAPTFSEIAADPELSRLHLIAEPWDTGAYQLGRGFPGLTWLQWNGRFRDDVRRFLNGDPGMVPDLMRRLYGSDDLFPDSRADAYHPYQSVNFVTCHDGFTLYDLVSMTASTTGPMVTTTAMARTPTTVGTVGMKGTKEHHQRCLRCAENRLRTSAVCYCSRTEHRCCAPETNSSTPSPETTIPIIKTTKPDGWTGAVSRRTPTSSVSSKA